MANFQIYLSGGMMKFGNCNFAESNDWRVYIKEVLYTCDTKFNLSIINPNDYFNFYDNPIQYKTQDEVMRFDLYKLKKSDLVIVNFNDPASLGTMAEMAIAYDRGMPIIGLNKDGQTLHPWRGSMSERVFDNINDLLDYVEDFYLR